LREHGTDAGSGDKPICSTRFVTAIILTEDCFFNNLVDFANEIGLQELFQRRINYEIVNMKSLPLNLLLLREPLRNKKADGAQNAVRFF
jgi:hypothetical protein